MNITLYTNNSDKNVVSKSLSNDTAVNNVLLKAETSVQKPVFYINMPSINLAQFNYLYAPDFGRYYYITDIVTRNAQNIEVHAEVDVLMSFQSQIRGLTAIVERQEFLYNTYINKLEYPVLNYSRIQTKKFPRGFSDTQTFVLITAGGDF